MAYLLPGLWVRELLCHLFPIARTSRALLARVWPHVPPWVRPFCSEALFRPRTQALWTAATAAVPVLGYTAVHVGGAELPIGAPIALAVLVESWIARCSLLAVVVAVSEAVDVALALDGWQHPVAAAIRAAAIVALAGFGRLGALGWGYVRDLHQHEMSALMSASHALDAPLDLAGVGAEAVRAAAGTVARPGLAGGRASALLRVELGRMSVVAACSATGVELLGAGGTDLGVAPLP